MVFVFIQFYATEFTITINKILISKKLNLLRLYIGLLVALGLSIVANFQETNILAIHSLGAAMTFFGGALYIVLHVRTIVPFVLRFKRVFFSGNLHLFVQRDLLQRPPIPHRQKDGLLSRNFGGGVFGRRQRGRDHFYAGGAQIHRYDECRGRFRF